MEPDSARSLEIPVVRVSVWGACLFIVEKPGKRNANSSWRPTSEGRHIWGCLMRRVQVEKDTSVSVS